MILRRPGIPDDQFVWQLTPDLDPEWADPEALRISRFHERFLIPDGSRHDAARIEDGKLAELMRSQDAWWEIQDLLRDAHLVGAVPSFDAAMVGEELHRCGLRTVWRHRLICVETMAATVLCWPTHAGSASPPKPSASRPTPTSRTPLSGTLV